MNDFISLKDWIFCENIVNYVMPCNIKFRAKRISTLFAYSDQYGYILLFDSVLKRTIITEEDALRDYEYWIEIKDKNGCHVQTYPSSNSIYMYTLPRNTRLKIMEKQGFFYRVPTNGWISKSYKLFKNNKTCILFNFIAMKKPIGIMIINPDGVEYTNKDKNIKLQYGDIIQVEKKGFVNDEKVFFYDNGYIKYEDTVLLGYIDNIPSNPNNLNCMICMNKEINSSILHGDIGHSFSCYDCAMKLSRTSCPICRLPIEKIIYNYVQSFQKK